MFSFDVILVLKLAKRTFCEASYKHPLKRVLTTLNGILMILLMLVTRQDNFIIFLQGMQ